MRLPPNGEPACRRTCRPAACPTSSRTAGSGYRRKSPRRSRSPAACPLACRARADAVDDLFDVAAGGIEHHGIVGRPERRGGARRIVIVATADIGGVVIDRADGRRRRADSSAEAVRKPPTAASGNTAVPMSRPPPRSPARPMRCCWATSAARTDGAADTGLVGGGRLYLGMREHRADGVVVTSTPLDDRDAAGTGSPPCRCRTCDGGGCRACAVGVGAQRGIVGRSRRERRHRPGARRFGPPARPRRGTSRRYPGRRSRARARHGLRDRGLARPAGAVDCDDHRANLSMSDKSPDS